MRGFLFEKILEYLYIDENFILITVNNKIEIGDASKTFKNKFVFCSYTTNL
jgi:rRNA-processing protein FCF1